MVASGGHVIVPTPQGYRGDGVFDNFWKLVERWKVTFIITVPTAIAAMMQRPVNGDISTVKTAFSGSSPLPSAKICGSDRVRGSRLRNSSIVDGTLISSSVNARPWRFSRALAAWQWAQPGPVKISISFMTILSGRYGHGPGDRARRAQ